jgi:hypothetical protein
MRKPPRGSLRYAIFVALELLGMAIILWDGLPIYRHLFSYERILTPADQAIMWCAVALIQFSYWYGVRHAPPFQLPQNAFIAHVVLFVSRLSFVFASSLFALVVYRNSAFLEIHLDRLVLLITVLFSVFCVTRSLETLGNLMLKSR